MRKINFLIGIHNHQPVGNFDFVIEDAFKKSYKPFIDTLRKFPSVRVNIHFSGYLLEWIYNRYPEYFETLKELLEKGQLEIFTGGYYEPILPVIPESDRLGQIKKLSEFIEKTLNYVPKGLWLAERVWEPQLASTLAKAGIKYVALDDSHFKNAGHYDDELTGYYMTEDQGKSLKVFPINERLRYIIPFDDAEKSIEYLKERATESGDNMYVMFDDGEKFGVWPGTNERVFKDGWLETFFGLLEENSDWLNTVTFDEFSQKHKAIGRTYIPTSSYSEMMNWALPSRARTHYERLEKELKTEENWERYSMFMKTGFWRTFLEKYSESNLMHKKMLNIREKYDDSMPSEILDNIWKGQANDAYWHGVFGGLYLPNLRHAIYENLIEAEKKIDEFKHDNQDFIEVVEKDFDLDGNTEILINTDKFSLGISPEKGGRIFEFSVKGRNINLSNNLTRRYEPYHETMGKAVTAEEGGKGTTLAKEKGLEKYLNYDWYERFSMIDHFFGEWNDLEKYSRSRYPEQGDFINQPYEYQVTARDTGEIKLWRKGHVWLGSLWLPIKVEKTLQMEDDGIFITHTITNESNEHVPLIFGCEYNINLLAPNSHDRYFYCPEFEKKTLGESGKVKAGFFGAKSEYEGVDISFQPDREVDFWFFPVYTVSYSEAGYERVYQSSSITPIWRFKLEPMGSHVTEMKIKVNVI